jgi:hypothetical protein
VTLDLRCSCGASASFSANTVAVVERLAAVFYVAHDNCEAEEKA